MLIWTDIQDIFTAKKAIKL